MFVSGAFVLTDTLGPHLRLACSPACTTTPTSRCAAKTDRRPRHRRRRPRRPSRRPRSYGKVRGRARGGKATGSVFVDGARVDRRERQGGGRSRRRAAVSARPGPASRRPDHSCAKGARPQAADEVVVNAGWRTAGGFHVGEQIGVLTLQPKQTFTVVGIFGYSGGRDSIGGEQTVAFTEPVAQKLMLGQPGVYSDRRRRGRPTSTDLAAGRDAAARGARQRVPGQHRQAAGQAERRPGLKQGCRLLQRHPARVRRRWRCSSACS